MNNEQNNDKKLEAPVIFQENSELIVPAEINIEIPKIKDKFMQVANQVMANEEVTDRVIYYNEGQDRGIIAGNVANTRQSVSVEKVGEGIMTTSTIIPIGNSETTMRAVEDIRGKRFTQDTTAIMVPDMSQTKISNHENK